MSYDLRAQAALNFPAPAATNLAFVAIEDSSIKAVLSGDLGYSFGLLWPREVYGRLVNELSMQGDKVTGFDVLFGELRPDQDALIRISDTNYMVSDDFFAWQMRRAGNVLIAVTPEIWPPDLFVTNALGLGDVATEKDPDGILRRVKTFRVYRRWAPLIQEAANQYDLDLAQAHMASGQITVPQIGTTNTVQIPIDGQTNYSLSDFVG